MALDGLGNHIQVTFSTNFSMEVAKHQLTDIRSKQFLLIARAGMSIPAYEMSPPQIHVRIMKQFHEHISSFIQPPSLRLIHLRTCKFMNDTTSPDDEHDGISLWRKYADIKRCVINQINPFYVKCLGKDGLIPCGKSKEEILLKKRQLLFQSDEDTAKTKSKNPRVYVMKDFTKDWYPQEWEVFLLYGVASEKPDKPFYIK